MKFSCSSLLVPTFAKRIVLARGGRRLRAKSDSDASSWTQYFFPRSSLRKSPVLTSSCWRPTCCPANVGQRCASALGAAIPRFFYSLPALHSISMRCSPPPPSACARCSHSRGYRRRDVHCSCSCAKPARAHEKPGAPLSATSAPPRACASQAQLRAAEQQRKSSLLEREALKDEGLQRRCAQMAEARRQRRLERDMEAAAAKERVNYTMEAVEDSLSKLDAQTADKAARAHFLQAREAHAW
eukprot:6197723-Pleurochrysis_carterae.AAC.1